MRMRADDEARATVDEMAEALLLAGRLRVKIENDRVRLLLQRAGRQNALRRAEGIIELGMHEDAAHDVGNQHTRAIAGIEQAGALAGRALRVIGGTQELVVALAEGHRLLLVPDMVAGGDDIRAGIDRFQIDVFGNPEAASGVLAIDDDEIQFQVGDQPRQFFPDGRASGLAHHISEKK